MKKSFRARFKDVWDDSGAMKNGIIKKVGAGDVEALDVEKHDKKVIEDTKERLKW